MAILRDNGNISSSIRGNIPSIMVADGVSDTFY
jgi:hypothetical protein